MKKIKTTLAVIILVVGLVLTVCDLAGTFMNQYVWNILYICVGIPASVGLLEVYKIKEDEV